MDNKIKLKGKEYDIINQLTGKPFMNVQGMVLKRKRSMINYPELSEFKKYVV